MATKETAREIADRVLTTHGFPKTTPYVKATPEVLIHEFDGRLPAPERIVRLASGLGQHFPKARIWITTDGKLRVFAKESSAKRIELMRAFCAGFAASF